MAAPDAAATPRPSLDPRWSFLQAAASSAVQKRKAAQELKRPVRNSKQEHPKSKAASDVPTRLQMASPQKSARTPKNCNPSGEIGAVVDLEVDEKPADVTQALKQMPTLTGQIAKQDARSGESVSMPPARLDQQVRVAASQQTGMQEADADGASDAATVPGTPPVSSSIDGCQQAQAPAAASGTMNPGGNDIFDDGGSDDELLAACRMVEAKVGGMLKTTPAAPAPSNDTASESRTACGTTHQAPANNGALPVAAAAGAPQIHPFDREDADIDAMIADEDMMEEEMALEAEAAAEAQFLAAGMKETPAEKKAPSTTSVNQAPAEKKSASTTNIKASQFDLFPAVRTPVAAESGEFAPTQGASCFKCGRSGHLARECLCKCSFRCRWMGGPCQADQTSASAGGLPTHIDEASASPAKTAADCFKCGNSGHWARDCPCTCGYRCQWQGQPCQGAAASRSTGSTIEGAAGSVPGATVGRECFKCGNSGHWARDCPCKCGWRCKNMGGTCPMASSGGGSLGGFGSMRETSSSLSLTNDFGGGGGNGLSATGMSGGAFGDKGCFKCGQFGHFASACTGQAGGGASGRTGSGRACFRCGQDGHFASQCPSRGI